MSRLRSRIASRATGAKVLAGAGIVQPHSPVTLARMATTMVRWGTGPAGGFTTLAQRWPDRPGIIDERGTVTWGDLHRRTNALANELSARGIGSGDRVAVMCRNHRYFIEACVAVAKLGADTLFLNTAFAGPQLVEVLERESPQAVIFDEEFSGLLTGHTVPLTLLAWTDEPGADNPSSLEALMGAGSVADLPTPERHGTLVILTSGTTGAPKGAPRKEAGLDAAVSMLSRIPLRAGWKSHIAAPLFHTWGFAHMALAMLLGTTMVLRRRFDPEECLAAAQSEGCDSVAVIPVMLQRILELPEETLAKYDLSRVKVVASSGSALPGDLALEWMDRFGDNLYNIYGSTEVSWATIADPDDLRGAPGTAGRPPHATVVKILDEAGREVPQGGIGRIFVGNGLLFEGYTNGDHKEIIDGLMSIGDVGRIDPDGRLFVEGRDDEMIVSGGENVFPREVEDCLARHDAVLEVAAIGVEDPQFGERLRVFVVRTSPDAIGEDEIREYVKANLARFKVPRDVIFLDELPRNATGKVLKRELVGRENV